MVRTNKLHHFDEGICFPDNCCYENGKKKKIFTVIIVTAVRGKDASLVNSMLNHQGHVTLTSWIF